MNATSPKPVLSIVVPVRNEQGNVAELISEIVTACGALGEFEIIYVNDGSSDNTAAELLALQRNIAN